jgi:hypothetical protein
MPAIHGSSAVLHVDASAESRCRGRRRWAACLRPTSRAHPERVLVQGEALARQGGNSLNELIIQ